MFVLRIVLLLYCSITVMSRGRGRNMRVSAEDKEQILATDDVDAAYDLYLRSYEDRDGPAMLMSVQFDPGTQQSETERKRAIFGKSFLAVKAHNSKFETGGSRFKMTVNAFSVMDEEERGNYLGATNATKSDGTRVTFLRGKNYPDTLNWHTKGYVTDSFDQGNCGSCWSFPAVALLEFAVKDATGKLIQLSNQQLLDCTYEHITKYGDHDGCEGGFYQNAWDFVIATQHIASLAKYKYREWDNKCDYQRYSNALENNVKITGYNDVPPNREGVLEAIQRMPLAVAIFAEDELYSYDKGLYDGCKASHDDPNHAVLLTGYGTNYWEIRNSWGPDWASNGYLKFYRGRGAHLCLLLEYAAYITYENLKGDTASDQPTSEPEITTNPASTSSDTPATTARQLQSSTSEVNVIHSEASTKHETNTTHASLVSSEHESPEVTTGTVTVKTNPTEKSAESTEVPTKSTITTEQFPTYTSDVSSTDRITTDRITTDRITTARITTARITTARITTDRITTARITTTQLLTTEYVEDCDRGYHWTGFVCEICDANFYSSYGARFCISCPDGTVSKEGSTSVQDCVEPIGECTDKYDDCPMWTGSGYKYCMEGDYTSFMENECRRSCGFCVDHCDAGYYRGDDGECQTCPESTYSEYMSGQCTACPANTYSPEGSTDISNCIVDEVCEDSASTKFCKKYVPRGYCETEATRKLMEKKCAKSCDFCTDDDANDCIDMYSTTECQDWKAKGLCYDTQFAELMLNFCGKTCGTCRRADEDANRCLDEDKYAGDCVVWAVLGYCDLTSEYAGFMMKSCRRSCRICEDTGYRDITTVQPIQPVATEHQTYTSRAVVVDCWINNSGISDDIIIYQTEYTTLDVCIDHCKANANCKGVMVSPSNWYYSECFVLGEEVVGTRYGWTAAKRSCFQPNYDTEVETGDDKECADSTEYESRCSDWAADVFCHTGDYINFMAQHCRKSCGICVAVSSCSDVEKHATNCEGWAVSGYCKSSSYREWMMDNCARSCGVCDEVTAGESPCSDTEEHAEDCGYWAALNYCSSGQYVQFMRDNCPRSCGRCDESGAGSGTGDRGSRGRGSSRDRGLY